MEIFFYITAGWSAILSVAVFIMCRADKLASKSSRRRIPEKQFFLLAAAGGAYGMWAGMLFFHHKTKHLSFVLAVSFGIVLWTGILFLLGIKCFSM